MTTSKHTAERRQHDRYPLSRDAYAVFRAESPKLAQLIDISEGGLAVWYVDGENLPASPLHCIDIFAVNSPVRVLKLPVELADDFVIDSPAHTALEPVRRRCFRFGDLMNTQRNAISDFIKDNASLSD